MEVCRGCGCGCGALLSGGRCASCPPWGHCTTCTAVLLDLQRKPEHRLNPQHVLDAHIEKMRAYKEEEA